MHRTSFTYYFTVDKPIIKVFFNVLHQRIFTYDN